MATLGVTQSIRAPIPFVKAIGPDSLVHMERITERALSPWTCTRVFTTSTMFETAAAIPPEMDEQSRYSEKDRGTGRSVDPDEGWAILYLSFSYVTK